jgi:hypothetical protein
MKRAFAIVGILTLMAVIAVPVLAQGPGAGRGRLMQGYGPGDPDGLNSTNSIRSSLTKRRL